MYKNWKLLGINNLPGLSQVHLFVSLNLLNSFTFKTFQKFSYIFYRFGHQELFSNCLKEDKMLSAAVPGFIVPSRTFCRSWLVSDFKRGSFSSISRRPSWTWVHVHITLCSARFFAKSPSVAFRKLFTSFQKISNPSFVWAETLRTYFIYKWHHYFWFLI